MADVEKAELAVKLLLSCFGVDTDKRLGMEETPKRVVKMLSEVWEGMQYTNDSWQRCTARLLTVSPEIWL